MALRIVKFGGSSVANAERIRNVAEIIFNIAKKDSLIIVVSAMQGITDQLLQCAHLAKKKDASFRSILQKISERHLDTAKKLLGKKNKQHTAALFTLLEELQNVLHGINLLQHAPPSALDIVASFGERLSAQMIATFLNLHHSSCFVDARDFIITDNNFTQANVHFEKTNPVTQFYFKKLFSAKGKKIIPVVTGFIASNEEGKTTTIGRNGSDYTAAIIGGALKASVIEIWTDVDGVLSADPRSVPSAFVLPSMSYEEAMELSYFGAKVIHSSTIAPAVAENIPIVIKNTLNPSARGTLISRSTEDWKDVAKGITSINDISLLNLRGLSMVGVPGTAARLFRALATHKVNVILISQASSEHTICFAIQTSFLHIATKALKEEFHNEFLLHNVTLDVKPTQTIVAIVGEGMKGTPGVAGKVFSALGQNNINISAIAQGASERNISFVVDSSQQLRTLNVIHQAFFEKKKRLSLALIGIGNIGAALIQQLLKQQQFLLNSGYDVRVCAIANSTKSLCNPNGISLTSWKNEFETSAKKNSFSNLLQYFSSLEFTNVALVDCTASQEVVDKYNDCVHANMHIVTPNKKANVLPLKRYQEFMQALQRRHKYFLYEANVGAGLPIISTLNDLIASGDIILKIEGIFSGTLSYLFNHFDGRIPFSIMLENAYEMAFTEPDPREDLSGMDVARKLLILARQIGYAMDLKHIQVENLVPRSLRKENFSKKFFANISKFDSQILKRYEAAQKRGCALRYVGTLDGTNASAGLQEFLPEHPFASTRGSDNIVAFTTQRYLLSPLVVQGPGAGADVTAMGVFSDILKLLHYLPY